MTTMPDIPSPMLPLNEVGRAKYDELTRLLHDKNKLTAVTVEQCELYAALYQAAHKRLSDGNGVDPNSLERMENILLQLNANASDSSEASAYDRMNKENHAMGKNEKFDAITADLVVAFNQVVEKYECKGLIGFIVATVDLHTYPNIRSRLRSNMETQDTLNVFNSLRNGMISAGMMKADTAGTA